LFRWWCVEKEMVNNSGDAATIGIDVEQAKEARKEEDITSTPRRDHLSRVKASVLDRYVFDGN